MIENFILNFAFYSTIPLTLKECAKVECIFAWVYILLLLLLLLGLSTDRVELILDPTWTWPVGVGWRTEESETNHLKNWSSQF